MTTRQPVPSPYLVPTDGSFRIADAACAPPDGTPGKKQLKKQLKDVVDDIADLQRMLYAHDKHALLLVFQAIDAAGKDSTIRNVLSGVNPAGCQVSSFKQPSSEELDHDFLWRTVKELPQRGRIGVFNRSYYEEVLVVKVHPEYLEAQKLPRGLDREHIWQHRYESIRDHEKHLARNGTAIVKFFLHVSRDEQRRRFLSRLDEPHKNWKFATGDVRERGFWDHYMRAYDDALNETARPWAPWYVIPADDKPFMRLTVAQILRDTMRNLGLRFPEPDEEEQAHFAEMRRLLMEED